MAEINPSFKIVSRDNREDTGHDSFTDREYMQETHNYLKINFDVITNSKDSERIGHDFLPKSSGTNLYHRFELVSRLLGLGQVEWHASL